MNDEDSKLYRYRIEQLGDSVVANEGKELYRDGEDDEAKMFQESTRHLKVFGNPGMLKIIHFVHHAYGRVDNGEST